MTNLERVLYYFKDLESPEHFIVWDYLYMVASCLGRKVCFQQSDFGVYPNLYLIIVGPPAVGKSLPANRLSKLLGSLTEPSKDGKSLQPMVQISPDCVTLESLYDFIESATRAIKTKHGNPEYYNHASVSFALGDEIGLLFKQKETTHDLVMFLIKGYECGDFKYHTKGHGKNEIKNMCINFLGCCTPTWITKTLTSDLIGEGFTSRAIFLWGDKRRQRTTIINLEPSQIAAMEEVKKHFRNLARLQDTVTMTDEAYKYLDRWVQEENEDTRINKDKRLEYYYGRKKIHLIKMAMLVHFSERLDMVLTLDDFKAAMKLLNTAEMDMHKALAVSTRNPLAAIAEQILKVIYINGTASGNKILAQCFDGGNAAEINEATKYLMDTMQIEGTEKGYRIKEVIPITDQTTI